MTPGKAFELTFGLLKSSVLAESVGYAIDTIVFSDGNGDTFSLDLHSDDPASNEAAGVALAAWLTKDSEVLQWK